MNEFFYCYTMDDIAMVDYSTEAHFTKTLDLLHELDLRGTFFVLPRSGGADLRRKPGYIALLERAVSEGHEIGQHGLDHDRFEAGIPPQMILDMVHEAPTREYLRTHRKEIDARHTLPALTRMIREGRSIIEEATGIQPVGFRGPSGAHCPNLHPALAAQGFTYDSTIMMQSGAWDLLNNCYTGPAPINRAIWQSAQNTPGFLVVPGAGEYTWYLPPENFDITMSLAKHDFHQCLEAGIPFVSVAHVSPIWQTGFDGNDSDIGARFYRELITYCREQVRQRGMKFTSLTLAEFTNRHTAAAAASSAAGV